MSYWLVGVIVGFVGMICDCDGGWGVLWLEYFVYLLVV